jgi:tagatose-1,6-bisphosphate aldolase non-catalytic subunit AgaZ/GatZ
MPTTAEVIEIARVTVAVVIKAIEQGQENDLELPNKIRIEANALEWVNTTGYTGINLNGFTDYVYGMCGGYAFEAEALMGVAGVVIDPSSGGNGRFPEQYSKFASSGAISISFSQALNKSLL